jgi:hypothetical protein
MATIPIVTDITAHLAGAWTASGFIDGLRAHIVATAGTTKLGIDDYNAAEGLTVGFLAGGEAHQTNLRKSGVSTIAVSIEPSGSITDAGNSSPTAPTGTSADWSSERTWTVGGSAGSKLWCVELDDAFFLLATNSTNVNHSGCILHCNNASFNLYYRTG